MSKKNYISAATDITVAILNSTINESSTLQTAEGAHRVAEIFDVLYKQIKTTCESEYDPHATPLRLSSDSPIKVL